MSAVVQALPSLQDPPLVGAQVPTEPGRLHALHWPQVVAVVLQQTPSTQLPVVHCDVNVHAAPRGRPSTFTTNVVCARLFDLSVALQVTVVLPMANTLPDAGTQVTGRAPSI